MRAFDGGIAEPSFLGPAGGGADGGGLGFSPWALLRAKWLILGTFLLFSGLALPYIWLFVHPTYTATAIIRVSPVVPKIVFQTEDKGVVPLYQSYLNTQVSIIKSPAVLERVLDRQDVQKTDWYTPDEPPVPGIEARDPLERMRDALSVRPRRNTELIDVSFSARGSKDATTLVDAVVDEYKRYLDETERETSVLRFEMLRKEQRALQHEIDGLVKTKFDLSKRLGTTGPEELRLQLSAHLNTLESEYARLQRQLAMAKWELEARTSSAAENAQANRATGAEGGSSDAAPEERELRYADDPEWRRLNLDAESARHQLELARLQYGESHPRIEQLSATVGHAERLLEKRESQLENRWAETGFGSEIVANQPATVGGAPGLPLEQQAKRLQRQVELLGAEIDDQRKKVADAGELAKQIAQYDEELRYKRELYDAVRSRFTHLEMESHAPARISVAAHAIEPSKPSRDRRMLLAVLAMGTAMMAGLAVGYMRIALDSRIREPGEVRRTVHAPFLGQLPPISPSADLMTETHPSVMESVRMVRTAMLERLNQAAANVVLVTSSSSRTGKTSMAILLARSLAMLGRKTLLVEADLRRPSLGGRLKIDAKAGLAALLSGTAKDESAIVRSRLAKLDVLTAGDLPEEFTSELLANGVLSNCLSRWKQQYDFVVLDSPPVLPVADARILAGQADGTLLVLRSAYCRRDEVVQACEDLSAAGGRLLGAVLVGRSGGSRYGYASGYEPYTAGDLAAVRG